MRDTYHVNFGFYDGMIGDQKSMIYYWSGRIPIDGAELLSIACSCGLIDKDDVHYVADMPTCTKCSPRNKPLAYAMVRVKNPKKGMGLHQISFSLPITSDKIKAALVLMGYSVLGKTLDEIQEIVEYEISPDLSTRPKLLLEGKEVWDKLGDIPVNNDGEIEESFMDFSPGTDQEDIWMDIEERYNVCVVEDLMQFGVCHA